MNPESKGNRFRPLFCESFLLTQHARFFLASGVASIANALNKVVEFP